MTDFPTNPKGDDCKHQASTSCVACIRTYIATQSNAVPLNEIKCPELGCISSIDYNHMRQYASAELFTRYDNYLHTIALQNYPNFIRCANEVCSLGGIVDISTTTYTVCSACKTKTCTTCKTLWHPDKTHDENLDIVQAEAEERGRDAARKVQEEIESAREVDAISKACPATTCGARIEKVDGCDHMTCEYLLIIPPILPYPIPHAPVSNPMLSYQTPSRALFFPISLVLSPKHSCQLSPIRH